MSDGGNAAQARIDAPIVNVKVQSRCKTSSSGMDSTSASAKVNNTGNKVKVNKASTMEVRFLH